MNSLKIYLITFVILLIGSADLRITDTGSSCSVFSRADSDFRSGEYIQKNQYSIISITDDILNEFPGDISMGKTEKKVVTGIFDESTISRLRLPNCSTYSFTN